MAWHETRRPRTTLGNFRLMSRATRPMKKDPVCERFRDLEAKNEHTMHCTILVPALLVTWRRIPRFLPQHSQSQVKSSRVVSCVAFSSILVLVLLEALSRPKLFRHCCTRQRNTRHKQLTGGEVTCPDVPLERGTDDLLRGTDDPLERETNAPFGKRRVPVPKWPTGWLGVTAQPAVRFRLKSHLGKIEGGDLLVSV